jgi:hypothetical protein
VHGGYSYPISACQFAAGSYILFDCRNSSEINTPAYFFQCEIRDVNIERNRFENPVFLFQNGLNVFFKNGAIDQRNLDVHCIG